jgi:hypothetical protein
VLRLAKERRWKSIVPQVRSRRAQVTPELSISTRHSTDWHAGPMVMTTVEGGKGDKGWRWWVRIKGREKGGGERVGQRTT